ncbi:MAG: hypothetical protein ABI647_14860 [Gemmatimonadota bacterium]
MIGRFTPAALVLTALTTAMSSDSARLLRQQRLWQSDIGIQSLTMGVEAGDLVSRVIIYAGMDDPSQGARLELLLPPGSAIHKMPPGCAADALPSGVTVRGRVSCNLGTLAVHERVQLVFASSIPAPTVPKSVAAFVSSDAPDPRPGDNFAMKTLP